MAQPPLEPPELHPTQAAKKQQKARDVVAIFMSKTIIDHRGLGANPAGRRLGRAGAGKRRANLLTLRVFRIQ